MNWNKNYPWSVIISFIEFHVVYIGIVKILQKLSRQCQVLIGEFAWVC